MGGASLKQLKIQGDSSHKWYVLLKKELKENQQTGFPMPPILLGLFCAHLVLYRVQSPGLSFLENNGERSGSPLSGSFSPHTPTPPTCPHPTPAVGSWVCAEEEATCTEAM